MATISVMVQIASDTPPSTSAGVRTCAAEEQLIHGIERRGADVAIDDAESAEGQGGKAAAPGVRRGHDGFAPRPHRGEGFAVEARTLHAAAGLSRHGADRKRPVLIASGRNPDAWRNRKDFVVFVGYGLFAALIRDHVISRPRVLAAIRS